MSAFLIVLVFLGAAGYFAHIEWWTAAGWSLAAAILVALNNW